MRKASERKAVLDFLRQLESHNDRGWFEENRSRYEAARAVFLELVGELIDAFGPVDDLGGVTVKECVFRINRDVRFSKDKSPYKTVMSAVLGRSGRKSGVRSYYFHIEGEGRSFLAGGLYAPSAAELGAVRQALADDARPFRKVIRAPAFVREFGELGGDSLKVAPLGYPKDHPDIELLRKKQFLVMHRLSDEEILSDELIPNALAVYKAMKPFLLYLEETIEA
jgi:uncharacterized protein (TIGR02453 family)